MELPRSGVRWLRTHTPIIYTKLYPLCIHILGKVFVPLPADHIAKFHVSQSDGLTALAATNIKTLTTLGKVAYAVPSMAEP